MTDDLTAAVERLRQHLRYLSPDHAADVGLVLSALESAQQDASRYRWLRDTPWSQEMAVVIVAHQNAYWDAAIDAALVEAMR